jgi:hypothetical protein
MIYKLKIIPITKKQMKSGYIPKYTVQIKEIDGVGNYIKFAKQDEETIRKLNQLLTESMFDMSDRKQQEKPKVLPGQTTIENAIMVNERKRGNEKHNNHEHEWRWLKNPKTTEECSMLECIVAGCDKTIHQSKLGKMR